MPETRSGRPIVFRLLHSSGDRLISDRSEALDRLAGLPGAWLFVVRAERPVSPAQAAA
jgi:hypothetical protein